MLRRHAPRRTRRTAIRLSFELDTEASDEELRPLLKLTERYCVVLQSLTSAPQLSTDLSRI